MWSKEEKESSWSDQLWEIDCYVLVPWMNTMGCKIRGNEVVSKIVERSYDWVIVKVRPGHLFFGVECRVCVDRNECGQKSCEDRRCKRKGSAGIRKASKKVVKSLTD